MDEYENWQNLYPPTESHWHDLKRLADFIIPIVGLLFLTTMYAVVGYAFIHMDGWVSDTFTDMTYYWYLARTIVTVAFPVVLIFAGLRYVFRQAREFISIMYQPDSEEKLSPLLRRKLLGVPPFPPPLSTIFKYPFVIIREPELKEEHWTRWFGGPATLVIYDGTALYLERGNTFSRVVGPGLPMPLLERHERIVDVVDLKPQTKSGHVEPWTKDGIHIKLHLKMEVQIHASAKALAKSSKLRYPFDPLAVKAAVEYSTVKIVDGKLKEFNWLEGAWGTVTGAVNAFVAGHSLDELFLAPQAENHTPLNHQKNHVTEKIEQILSRRISEQVLEKVQMTLQRNGIRVLNIQITEVEVPKEIQDLRTKYWKSIRQIISAQRNSRAEAERIRIREQAHADAQRTILMTITQKLENIDPDDMTEPLILSLSGLLDQGLEDPLIRPWIANESFTVLERMRKLLKERF